RRLQLDWLELQAERAGGGLERFDRSPAVRIVEDRDARETRQRFLEQLQALAAELGLQREDAGDVTARATEALDQTRCDRIVVIDDHDDRDRRGRLLRSAYRGVIGREDYVDLELDQVL